MTHIETQRFNEVIGLQIAAIKETAHKLNENRDLEELEAIVAELEGMLAELRNSLGAMPHKRP